MADEDDDDCASVASGTVAFNEKPDQDDEAKPVITKRGRHSSEEDNEDAAAAGMHRLEVSDTRRRREEDEKDKSVEPAAKRAARPPAPPPSKVLHFRGLPSNVTKGFHLLSRYVGHYKHSNTLAMPTQAYSPCIRTEDMRDLIGSRAEVIKIVLFKSQALIELDTLLSAERMIDHFTHRHPRV
eukprot:18095-Heterococcus_DN1.PRE.1